MKRAPIILAATAAGLGATLGFSPHTKAPVATAVTTTSAPATTSSSQSSTTKSSTTKSSTTKSSTATVTGDAISTRYGNVQLKVTVSGGKITNVQAVQLPSSDPKSAEISNYAAPQLQQSALTKQSANVDVVSGATYTSDGYKTALQSALDKAAATTGNTTAAG